LYVSGLLNQRLKTSRLRGMRKEMIVKIGELNLPPRKHQRMAYLPEVSLTK